MGPDLAHQGGAQRREGDVSQLRQLLQQEVQPLQPPPPRQGSYN